MIETSGLRHPYVMLASILAMAGFAYAAFSAYQSYLTVRGSELSTTTPTQANHTNRQTTSLTRVINAHLFGQKKAASRPALIKATKTRLNLVLEGVIAASSPDFARAIIAVDKKRAQPYSVGQSLDGVNAKIHSIESRKVLLSRNGKLESLEIDRSKLPSTSSPAASEGVGTSKSSAANSSNGEIRTHQTSSAKRSPQQAAKIRKQRRVQSKLKRLESAMPNTVEDGAKGATDKTESKPNSPKVPTWEEFYKTGEFVPLTS